MTFAIVSGAVIVVTTGIIHVVVFNFNSYRNSTNSVMWRLIGTI